MEDSLLSFARPVSAVSAGSPSSRPSSRLESPIHSRATSPQKPPVSRGSGGSKSRGKSRAGLNSAGFPDDMPEEPYPNDAPFSPIVFSGGNTKKKRRSKTSMGFSASREYFEDSKPVSRSISVCSENRPIEIKEHIRERFVTKNFRKARRNGDVGKGDTHANRHKRLQAMPAPVSLDRVEFKAEHVELPDIYNVRNQTKSPNNAEKSRKLIEELSRRIERLAQPKNLLDCVHLGGLYMKRSREHAKLSNFSDSISDAHQALYFDANNTWAHEVIAKAQLGLSCFPAAARACLEGFKTHDQDTKLAKFWSTALCGLKDRPRSYHFDVQVSLKRVDECEAVIVDTPIKLEYSFNHLCNPSALHSGKDWIGLFKVSAFNAYGDEEPFNPTEHYLGEAPSARLMVGLKGREALVSFCPLPPDSSCQIDYTESPSSTGMFEFHYFVHGTEVSVASTPPFRARFPKVFMECKKSLFCGDQLKVLVRVEKGLRNPGDWIGLFNLHQRDNKSVKYGGGRCVLKRLMSADEGELVLFDMLPDEPGQYVCKYIRRPRDVGFDLCAEVRDGVACFDGSEPALPGDRPEPAEETAANPEEKAAADTTEANTLRNIDAAQDSPSAESETPGGEQKSPGKAKVQVNWGVFNQLDHALDGYPDVEAANDTGTSRPNSRMQSEDAPPTPPRVVETQFKGSANLGNHSTQVLAMQRSMLRELYKPDGVVEDVLGVSNKITLTRRDERGLTANITHNREMRVYVSSVGFDTEMERTEFHTRVTDALRLACDERFVSFSSVDLRWGKADSLHFVGNKTMCEMVVEEIKNCHPYFVSFVGQKYGLVPPTLDMDIIRLHPWMLEHRNPFIHEGIGMSFMELEIVCAMLKAPKQARHCFFYERRQRFLALLDAHKREFYTDHRPDFCAALEDLKTRMRNFPNRHQHLRMYTKPTEMAEQLVTDLLDALNTNYPADRVPDDLERLSVLTDLFAESLRFCYDEDLCVFNKMPTASVLEDALSSILLPRHSSTEHSSPLIIVGASGCGKSAAVVNWLHHTAKGQVCGICRKPLNAPHCKQRGAGDIARFVAMKNGVKTLFVLTPVNAIPGLSSGTAVLRRLVHELRACFPQSYLDDAPPTTPDQLAHKFPRYLAKASMAGAVVFVLDGLERLDKADRNLHWLPSHLPSRIKIVGTVTWNGGTMPSVLEEIQRREWPTVTAALPMLHDLKTQADYLDASTKKSKKKLIKKIFLHYARKPAKELVLQLTNSALLNNVGSLRMLVEELRGYTVWESIEEHVNNYLKATTQEELQDLVLARILEEFPFVKDCLLYLSLSREGLQDVELRQLLGVPQTIAVTDWSRMRIVCMPGLLNSFCGLLRCTNPRINLLLRNRYLKTPKQRADWYKPLVDYFSSRPVGRRKVVELPYYLKQQSLTDRLLETCLDFGMFLHLYGIAEHRADFLGYIALANKPPHELYLMLLKNFELYYNIYDKPFGHRYDLMPEPIAGGNYNTFVSHVVTMVDFLHSVLGVDRESIQVLDIMVNLCHGPLFKQDSTMALASVLRLLARVHKEQTNHTAIRDITPAGEIEREIQRKRLIRFRALVKPVALKLGQQHEDIVAIKADVKYVASLLNPQIKVVRKAEEEQADPKKASLSLKKRNSIAPAASTAVPEGTAQDVPANPAGEGQGQPQAEGGASDAVFVTQQDDGN